MRAILLSACVLLALGAFAPTASAACLGPVPFFANVNAPTIASKADLTTVSDVCYNVAGGVVDVDVRHSTCLAVLNAIAPAVGFACFEAVERLTVDTVTPAVDGLPRATFVACEASVAPYCVAFAAG